MTAAGRLSSAEIALRGLDAMDVMLATPDEDDAGRHARSMLDGLDDESLRRVAAYLAHVAVAALRLRRDDGAVRRLFERWRLEATAELPAADR